MCMFPILNTDFNGIAYKKGVREFECGACPECLRKRAGRWALRAVYEAREHVSNIMCTLTYDNYIKDKNGNILGELPPDRTLLCNVRDCQLFIKRMRKKFGSGIKYILTAEHGSRTNRAHYHVLFFGLKLDDCIPYKRSKRGNMIYKSATLTKVWGHGICTVDALNVGASVARYCTKYCAKDSRCADTFMLFSRNIGTAGLYRDFNGKSYIVEGREYPVPRQIIEKYIMDCYSGGACFSPRYVPHTDKNVSSGVYERSRILRRNYRAVRDADPTYQAYLKYWSDMHARLEPFQKTPAERIKDLPEDKYHFYKIQALDCLSLRRSGIPVPAPRSGHFSEYYRYLHGDNYNKYFVCVPTPEEVNYMKNTRFSRVFEHLPLASCHKTANDTCLECLTFKKCVNGRFVEFKIPYVMATEEDFLIFK